MIRYRPGRSLKPFRHTWLWCLLWCLGIAGLVVLSLMPGPPMPDFEDSDKVGHFLAYGLLAAGAVQLYGRWSALLRQVIEAGIARGVFRPGSPEALRQMVFHPLLMQSVLQHSMVGGMPGRPLPEQYFEIYFDFILRGLGAADTQEPR